MSAALNEAIKLAMRRDDHVILMGEDVAGGANVDHLQDDEAWGGVLGVTKGIVQEFGRESCGSSSKRSAPTVRLTSGSTELMRSNAC